MTLIYSAVSKPAARFTLFLILFIALAFTFICSSFAADVYTGMASVSISFIVFMFLFGYLPEL